MKVNFMRVWWMWLRWVFAGVLVKCCNEVCLVVFGGIWWVFLWVLRVWLLFSI